MDMRHPTGLRTSHRPRHIGDLISIAHSVIEELDPAPVRDRVDSMSRGDAVQVGATASASAAGVEFARAVADS